MKQLKRRNPLALNPLLAKGGVHKKSKKAERQALKQATRKLVAEIQTRSE